MNLQRVEQDPSDHRDPIWHVSMIKEESRALCLYAKGALCFVATHAETITVQEFMGLDGIQTEFSATKPLYIIKQEQLLQMGRVTMTVMRKIYFDPEDPPNDDATFYARKSRPGAAYVDRVKPLALDMQEKILGENFVIPDTAAGIIAGGPAED